MLEIILYQSFFLYQNAIATCGYVPKKKAGAKGSYRTSKQQRLAKMALLKNDLKIKNEKIDTAEKSVKRYIAAEDYETATQLQAQLVNLRKERRDKKRELKHWKGIQKKSGT